MSKKKTKDLSGMLVLEDEDGGELKLKGFDNKTDCSEIGNKKKCKRAYRREVREPPLSGVLLRSCTWSKQAGDGGGGCVDSAEVVDVTSCVLLTATALTTNAERWWYSWGRAVSIGAVLTLPMGAVALWRNRRLSARQTAGPAAEARGPLSTVEIVTASQKQGSLTGNDAEASEAAAGVLHQTRVPVPPILTATI